MRKLVIICLFTSIIFAQQRSSYSWEDGTGTILGSYGNLVNPANVGTTSGISPYDGSLMLTVSESPIDGTPQAFIAWVTDLSAGQDITACFYGYDNTPNSAPSLRIWGNWSTNDDITSYGGSADGNSDYTAGTGWGQVCHTFSTNHDEWESGEALVIQARLYSSSSGPDPTVYFIDLVEVTAPGSATVNYPGTSAGCMDDSACNYNPFVVEDDGSCVYSIGDKSINEIQFNATDSGTGYYDCYPSPYGIFPNEDCVQTSGVVIAIDPEYNNFYLSDETGNTWGGIYVYDADNISPSIGDKIEITAIVHEEYGFTQLLPGYTSANDLGSGNITPIIPSTGDFTGGCVATGEPYEGMLVQLSNIYVTQSSDEYGNFYVSDGASSEDVKISSEIFDGEDWPDPSLGQEYDSIIGMVYYAYGEFSILPRTMSDITLCPTCPVADAGDDQLVPPGTAIVTLDGSDSYDPNGSITSYEWAQLSGTAVELSNEEASVTTFTAPETEGDLVFRLTVYDNDFMDATDEITITVGTGDSIYDIQYTADQGQYCYDSDMDGEAVTVTGVITAVESVFPSFFIQDFNFDTYGGIYARSYLNTIPGEWSPVIGDKVTVSGTVSEYYSFTQLEPLTSYTVNSEGNNLEIKDISTGDLYSDPLDTSTDQYCSETGEAVEGMLVRISNVTVVKEANTYGEWYVDDGSGPCIIDDGTQTSPLYTGSWISPNNGDTFDSIVGVVTYGYGRFRILPRDSNDFE